MEASVSRELPGLEVVLDRLVYQYAGDRAPRTPHAFVYYLTIRNGSADTVRLLGRRWVIEEADGERTVVEGDGIVGETPHLAPGESFSYHSFHLCAGDAAVAGSFHGMDAAGGRIHVRVPGFALRVPKETPEG